MSKRTYRLTHQRLLEVLDYDPDTGVFIWKQRISIRVQVGKAAGTVQPNGSTVVTIDGEAWTTVRLALFYVTGAPPKSGRILTANGNASDARWDNIKYALDALPDHPTVERVREVLTYDRETGHFQWNIARPGRAGRYGQAGTTSPDGRVLICVDGHDLAGERMAWLHVTGEWPDRNVTHVNGIKSDNRWDNLALGTAKPRQARYLDPEQVRALVDYDPTVGVFTWRMHRGGTSRPGEAAGTMSNDGYIAIAIAGQRWLAHRLAWIYVTGDQPPPEIDHIDGDRKNNRWDNLRSVDRKGNCENLKGPQRNNTSGYLGVSLNKQSGLYSAQITHNWKAIPLGQFETPELAHAAYLGAKRVIHVHGTL